MERETLEPQRIPGVAFHRGCVPISETWASGVLGFLLHRYKVLNEDMLIALPSSEWEVGREE